MHHLALKKHLENQLWRVLAPFQQFLNGNMLISWSDILLLHVTRQKRQLKKCCNLIGAATIDAASTSQPCVNRQTNHDPHCSYSQVNIRA